MTEALNNQETLTIPIWFKVIAVIALLWNLLGVLAFVGQMFMTPEMLAELPAAEQELYANTPIWATAAFAVGVFCGAIGSLFLLLKKSLATALLAFSLFGVLIQMLHSIFISKSLDVLGPSAAIMPTIVILIGIFLVWLANKAQKQGWLS